MSEAEFVDGVVLEAIDSVAGGAPCCVDRLEEELGFSPADAIDRLIDSGKVRPVRGHCSHCGSMLYSVNP